MVYGDKSRVRSRIITMMKDRKSLVKGCTTFLAYVIDEKKEKRAMTNIIMVQDFLEVFFERITRITT